jgi:predicted amidohydrolase
MLVFAVSRILHAAEMPESLKVASVQMVVSADIDANLARILRGVDEAAAVGARLVMFPECVLSGFDKDTVSALDWNKVKTAQQKVADSAKSRGIYVLYGCVTPSDKNRPFNSAILVGPDGAEVMQYHKMVPETWFEPGDHLALFEVDGIPCTVIVCHDERMPELVRIPTLAGARICFYISYEINGLPGALRKMEGYRAQLIARAAENGIWVLQSNGITPPGKSDAVSLGRSIFVDPGGGVIKEAPALADYMNVGEIKPGDAHRGNALESLQIIPLRGWWHEAVAALKRTGTCAMPTTAPVAPTKDKIRLALMRGIPDKWNLQANFDAFLAQLEAADKDGAEIFMTPECWLDGYAAPDKTSTPDRLREVAQSPKDSPYLKRVSEEAARRAMWICFGFTSLEEGRIYNSAGLWVDTGKLVGIYHKTHLQTHDLQYSEGEDLPVWQSPWGPLGIMICADRRWPETARTLRLKGARLILNPTYGMHHEANRWWMRTRGYENQCFIAFAHPEESFVANPDGGISAEQEGEENGLLICDLDLSKAKDDNHLRDRRPDLYTVMTERTAPADPLDAPATP